MLTPHLLLNEVLLIMCAVYPNDADLGAIIRKHFGQNAKRE